MSKRVKAIAAGLFLCLSPSVYADAAFTPDQQKAIEKITHDYLLSNPKILTEMITNLQKQQQAQWLETAKKVVPQSAKALFSSHESPAIGNPDGDVTLVEFFDYECPHCKEMTPQVVALVKNDKNLNIIFKPLPIFGNMSVYAAKAGLAAAKQGKFNAFHTALMGVQTDPLTQDIILKVAGQAGLDVNKLQTDMKNPAFDEELKQNNQLARDLKLTGTPAFVAARVKGDKIENPVLVPGAVPAGVLNNVIAGVRSGQTK
jgi:protein-disulfide isomerase